VRSYTRTPAAARVLDRVAIDGGCWRYQGSKNQFGYGVIGVTADGGKKNCKAHRVVYEALVGPIPEGLTLDHLCRVKDCVNPAHLEPVTAIENYRRHIEARGPRDHCRNGHDLSRSGYQTPAGKLTCRSCNAAAVRRYQLKKSQHAGALHHA
jgi:hypothetical protein